MRAIKTGSILGLLVLFAINLQAQYFGRNKPNYENFDFKVYQSPNFEIYHYLKDEQLLQDLTNQSEHWYQLHQNVLKDTIKTRNPIIFYNNHPDFQQTNAISGAISVGTGGVTEALKNRVILPLAMSNQQTHHVLGHELVHAFQYNMIIAGDSTSLSNLGNLPLWMVEGLAEYLSIGSVDAHTAMWMRDAVLNDDVPTLKDLNNPKYFPYRYGQAFWSFLTGLKGDDIIEPFFVGTAKYGLEQASQIVLGMSQKNLSELWTQSIRSHFGQYVDGKEENLIGKPLINKKNAGQMNISPVISPNGRYVIFLSEKDLFSIDIYLADARSGEILRKVASSTRDSHIDDFSFIESAGTWSPNSEEFAFVAVSKGKNILVIKDVMSGKTVKEIAIRDVPAFSNPAWSPDGKSILVSGLVDGQTDLYTVEVRTGKVNQLTNDRYSEMHPYWSDDGSYIVFASDQLSMTNGMRNGRWSFNLARLDVGSGTIDHYDIFPGADNLNPVIDTSGNIIFLSNRDGFRNIYRYEPGSGKVTQLTDFLTGVTGITHYAPAISIERRRGRLVYTYYSKNNYSVYRARAEDFLTKEVDPDSVDFSAAQLPRINKQAPLIVDQQLRSWQQLDELPADAFAEKKYQPRFKLDYIAGSAGVGIGSSPAFGTTSGLAGGINMIFSDMLGDHQLLSTLSLNGEIQDFGGAVAYINRRNRLNWGGQLSHIPFRSLQITDRVIGDSLIIDDQYYGLTDHWTLEMTRLFEDKAMVFAHWPFSKTLRVEAGGSFSMYNYRVDRLENYYNSIGQLIYQDREKVDLPDDVGFNLATVEAALVGDNSNFGLTAPLQGHRFRLGVEKYFGEFDFFAPTADLRLYRFFKPFGLAFRALHYGRYGGNSENLFPLYLGSPWYMRGYSYNDAQQILLQNGNSIDQLFGSKLFVSNFEVRIPFSGPERLSLIKSGFLFTDLNFFVDGGVTWFDFEQFGSPQDSRYLEAKPFFSAGASVRVNLFGALILEPYYAFPIMKETKGVFGLNLIPGW